MKPYPRPRIHWLVAFVSAACAGIFVLMLLFQKQPLTEALTFGAVLFASFLGAAIFTVEAYQLKPNNADCESIARCVSRVLKSFVPSSPTGFFYRSVSF